MILLLAAIAKWLQLPFLDRTGDGLMHSPAIAVALIGFEVALTGLLVIGVLSRWATWIPSVCFVLFACVALYLAVSGSESCGCFGRVKVNPWVTFGMDATLATGLFIWPPRLSAPKHVVRWGGRLALLGIVVSLTLGLSVWRVRSVHAPPETPGFARAGSLTILEPQQWVGKALPLMPDLDVGIQLQAGKWLAVLYHSDCSTCREAMPGYEQMSSSRNVTLLEMPPYASTEERLTHSDSRALLGRLSDKQEWFATTPVVLLLENGVVRDVLEGKAAVGAGVDWGGMKFRSAPPGADER